MRAQDATNTEKGKGAEHRVGQWLRGRGLEVKVTSYNAPFDLLVNGWRCEVKHANPNERGAWSFNIHRHGKLDETHVDFYIFSFDRIPFHSNTSIYVVVSAPLKIMTATFSLRQLLTQQQRAMEIPGAMTARNPDTETARIASERWLQKRRDERTASRQPSLALLEAA